MHDRDDMVLNQLKSRDIVDLSVLKAMSKVPREFFVLENQKHLAYADIPLPIGYGQTISQPYIVAFMSQMLKLKSESRVLEIGTGCGYQSAILAEVAKEVYSVELVKELAEEAEIRLKSLGYNNIFILNGDGFLGWPDAAPFDAIIVTAAPERIPENLVKQLKIGGRLIIPVGAKDFQELKLIIRYEDSYKEEVLMPVRFVPLVHRE